MEQPFWYHLLYSTLYYCIDFQACLSSYLSQILFQIFLTISSFQALNLLIRIYLDSAVDRSSIQLRFERLLIWKENYGTIKKSKFFPQSDRSIFNFKETKIKKIYKVALENRGGQFENFQEDPEERIIKKKLKP